MSQENGSGWFQTQRDSAYARVYFNSRRGLAQTGVECVVEFLDRSGGIAVTFQRQNDGSLALLVQTTALQIRNMRPKVQSASGTAAQELLRKGMKIRSIVIEETGPPAAGGAVYEVRKQEDGYRVIPVTHAVLGAA